MNTVKLEGTKREGQGKKDTQTLRDNKQVPCNLYGTDDNISFTLTAKDVRGLIYSPEFRIAEISVNGATHQAIVKEIQMDPLSDEVTHIDFLALKEGKQITVDLPLKFVGTPKGVRDGGKLTQKIRRIKVKTSPDKLVPALEVNVEHMELGKTLRVGDIKIPGIEVMLPENLPLASVFIPRVIVEEPKAAAAPVAGAAAPAEAAPAPAAAPAKETKK